MLTLDRLISPNSVETFLSQFWGKKALHIQGSSEKFPDLFGWNDIEKILNYSRPSFNGINLIYEKNGLPVHELKQIDQWLQKGATLLVKFVNQIDERLDSLASELGNDLNTVVTINCYVSCPAKQGFDIHFDKHDVYVIQSKGRKKWFVYEPTSVKSPMEKQQLPREDLPKGDPYLECELEEGDVLYIPRGHWHYAVAVTPSIHLSVGPEARTPIDLLNWLIRQLMDQDEFFRSDFPLVQSKALGGNREDSALEAHLEVFRQSIHQLLEHKEIMSSLVRFCMQANPVRRRYQMPDMWELKEKISPQTSFSFNPVQKALFNYDQINQMAIVQTRGNSFMFKGPESLFTSLFSGRDTFCGQELLDSCPQMNWEKLKVLLIQMYERGIVLHTTDPIPVPPQAEILT